MKFSSLRGYKKLSTGDKLSVVFYPVVLFFMIPIMWAKSLWSARILLDGRWSAFMSFDRSRALNNFFYKTQWINLDRFGRRGESTLIGLGRYPLRQWFHISLPSSYIYSSAGAVVVLVSTMVWSLSHMLWMETYQTAWVLVVTSILALSSTSYAMAFARQNYQMLGWMFMPAALFFCEQQQYEMAAFAWFLAGLAGITPVFFSVPICIAVAFIHEDPWLLFVIVPALAYSAIIVFPLLVGSQQSAGIVNIAKLIGARNKTAVYKRNIDKLSLSSAYYLLLYGTCTLLFGYIAGEIPWLLLVGVALFFVNQRMIRVADEESLIIIFATLFTYMVMQANPGWMLVFVYWLVVNPSGHFLLLQRFTANAFEKLPKPFSPYDHSYLEREIERFFSDVESGSRVFFAFDNPKNSYENVFDGYRVIVEPIFYVAVKKYIHLLPDWWAVGETNYAGAPNLWGRTVEEVESNCRTWSADYVIVYQKSGAVLEECWQEGFSIVSTFDWGDPKLLLNDEGLWTEDNPPPQLFLLRCAI